MEFSKIIDWIKLKPRHLVAIVVVSGTLLFSPDYLLSRLGLLDFVLENKSWIGGTFLTFIAFLLINTIAYLSEPVQGFINDWRRLLVYSRHLKELTSKEKKTLKKYFEEDTQSQLLDYKSGVAQGLVAKKILYRSSNLGYMEATFAYNIQPWAWRYLKKHPDLLKINEDNKG